jgi:hypothetical protein
MLENNKTYKDFKPVPPTSSVVAHRSTVVDNGQLVNWVLAESIHGLPVKDTHGKL